MKLRDAKAGDIVVIEHEGRELFVLVGTILGREGKKKRWEPRGVLVHGVDHETLSSSRFVTPVGWISEMRILDPDIDVMCVVEPMTFRRRMMQRGKPMIVGEETDPLLRARRVEERKRELLGWHPSAVRDDRDEPF